MEEQKNMEQNNPELEILEQLKKQNEILDETRNYEKMIAAQNESNRRLKICKITRTIVEEDKKRCINGIISGVSVVGLMAATHFSGIDMNQAIQTEFQALNSASAFKEYLSYFTPAMWTSLAGTAVFYLNCIKHNRAYKNAKDELNDMDLASVDVCEDVVENHAKLR